MEENDEEEKSEDVEKSEDAEKSKFCFYKSAGRIESFPVAKSFVDKRKCHGEL